MIKQVDGAGSWFINDTARNWRADNSTTGTRTLYAQSANAEGTGGADWNITSTGFTVTSGTGTFIYIACRRGPMKVPTTGTSVFAPVIRTGTGATATGTAGFASDLMIPVNRPHDVQGATPWFDKLRGANQAIYSNTTGIEENRADTFTFSNTGVIFGTNAIANSSGASYVNWYFQRAPGFFDEVCYTADSVNGRTINHNLTVAPEFTIFKSRTLVSQWYIWHNALTLSEALNFNTNAVQAGGIFTSSPTSSAVFVSSSNINFSSLGNVVGYLFATCAGVSKVGSYTGTGTTQTINCGFTAGSRFILIKRTDSTGDWYVWDSARGIIAGDDPYLLINSTAAEVTNTDYVDTANSGFEISSTAPAGINANGGTYIFLAIA
jgi:hypothetical protein